MATRPHLLLQIAPAVLLVLHCKPRPAQQTPPARVAARTHATTGLERYVARAAPSAAVSCGVGRGASSDAAVYQCGREALIQRRPFYAVFLPWSRTPSDIIATPDQTAIAYIADSAQTITAVTQIADDQFRTARVLPGGESSAVPMHPLRGMRLPRFASPRRPVSQPRSTIIIEAAVDSAGRVSAARILKPLANDADERAIALVRGSVIEPARLFGIGVPVITTVAVDVADSSLAIRPSAPPQTKN